nr:MAG TPA: Prohead core protein serine protease [Ackermannviridae sp.]
MANKTELVEIKSGKTGTGLLIEQDGYVSLKNNPNLEQLKEDVNNKEWHCPYPFIVSAVFQKFDIKNANGRIYPKNVLMKQVEVYQKKIEERRAYGECNHPSESTIDLGRISHNILELHWEGNTLVGEMEINITEGFRRMGICSSYGDTIANMLLNGYKLGVSSRGVGSVEQKMGQYIVGDDFELICWDIVSDPSTPMAYISTNGREGLETYIENKENKNKNIISEKISQINKILSE